MNSSKNKKPRRVVVTGLGVVSSLGIGWEEFWKNLIAGKSGISKITAFDTSQYDRHYAGEVKDFDPEKFINKRKIKSLGRASQMAIAASKLALKDAGLKSRKYRETYAAICIGTTMGEPQVMERMDEQCYTKNKYEVDFLSALTYPASLISSNVAKELKFIGPNVVFANACSAGNYATARAYDLIKLGKVDIALAGGADAFSRIAYTGFFRLYAIAPEKCQPFDKNRKGMIPGEGAGVLVLESLESAQKRKAKIYAEILGYGMSCDARHMTNPSSKEIVKSIRKSIQNAGINKEQVDYISAHGTGTLENDKSEVSAFCGIFGDHVGKIPISSIKSMLGHTMGAASALETIACCLAIEKGDIPPTINFQTEDSECEIDCVANTSRKHTVRIALNNSQAFGGNNSCLVLTFLGDKN